MPARAAAKKKTVARRTTPPRVAKKTSPKSAPAPATKTTKIDQVGEMLRRKEGATIEQLMVATSWQAHSVRGALAGAVPKKFGQAVTSTKGDGARVYRLEA